jgi:hypothetical protein
MSEEAAFDQLAEDVKSVLFEDATFIPQVGDRVSLKVRPVQNVEYHPQDFIGVTRFYARTIEFLFSDLGRLPERGEEFLIGSDRYSVAKIIEHDGDGRFVMAEVS